MDRHHVNGTILTDVTAMAVTSTVCVGKNKMFLSSEPE